MDRSHELGCRRFRQNCSSKRPELVTRARFPGSPSRPQTFVVQASSRLDLFGAPCDKPTTSLWSSQAKRLQSTMRIFELWPVNHVASAEVLLLVSLPCVVRWSARMQPLSFAQQYNRSFSGCGCPSSSLHLQSHRTLPKASCRRFSPHALAV